MIIGTVVLGQYLIDSTPIGNDHRRPYLNTGVMGEPVDAGQLEVTVLATRGGRVIDDFSGAIVTDGVFVVVKLRVVAKDVRTRLGYAAIRDARDIWYESADHDALTLRELHPRIPMEGEVAFELPVAAADGPLTLRLSAYSGYSHRYQVAAEIPLDIDSSDVDSWYRDDEPLTIMTPEVVAS
jgi:hypothetical protein